MSPRVRTQNTDELIARWERKLERLHLGVPPLLCQSELFTRLYPRKVDKCKWYELPDDAELSEHFEQLHRVLKRLSYRERRIISLYYGIEDGYSYTFQDIGRIFKISKARIAQIRTKAVQKMSDYIVDDVVNRVRHNHQPPEGNKEPKQ